MPIPSFRLTFCIAGLIALLAVTACGEATPVSPEQATRDAVVEQTKTWEKARDKIHRGWDEEERIRGKHCFLAGDDIHPSFKLAELAKAEIEHPETFYAKLGKDVTDERPRYFFMDSLDGKDVKRFDIPISEEDIENIKHGAKLITPYTYEVRVTPEHEGVWTDRPKHYARLDFRTDSDPDDRLSRYLFFRAYAFVDHWTCDVKLVELVEQK